MAQQSLQALLKKYGIRPKKRLGQHFLAAKPTIEKIVGAIDPSKDECVLEIGPGPGIMTGLLAERAGFVIAVERDERLIEIAREEHRDLKNVEWLTTDILKLDIDEALSRLPASLANRPIRVAGNLPYNISSPILFWILENRRRISKAVVMVQKEVALRLAASPGGKDYGALSVGIQAYARARRLFDVSPKNFIPPPEVTSSIAEIDFHAAGGPCPDDKDSFSKVVRAAFGKRRKTLRNALLGSALEGLTPAKLDRALTEAGIEGRRRPETLSVQEFIRLASLLR